MNALFVSHVIEKESFALSPFEGRTEFSYGRLYWIYTVQNPVLIYLQTLEVPVRALHMAVMIQIGCRKRRGETRKKRKMWQSW